MAVHKQLPGILVEATLDGVALRFFVRNMVDDVQHFHLNGQFYESDALALMRRWFRPGGVFLDVGANVGYFTALAARRVGPAGRVFAVEPNPSAYARLRRMVDSNGLSHCTAERIGLSAAPGEVTLYVPPPSHHNDDATMVPVEGWAPTPVPVRTLDECLDEWGVSAVDLLKIDVEGHEPSVVRGAARSLAAGRIRAVLCEFNDYWLRRSGSSPLQLWQALSDAGFVAAGAADPRRAPDFPRGSMPTLLMTHSPQGVRRGATGDVAQR